MLVASTSMVEISRLARLVRTFDMKGLGATKTKLEHRNTQRQERW
jgi:hypothetical protein